MATAWPFDDKSKDARKKKRNAVPKMDKDAPRKIKSVVTKDIDLGDTAEELAA